MQDSPPYPDPIPMYKPKIISLEPTVRQGLAQAPLCVVPSLSLGDSLDQLLGLIGCMSSNRVQYTDQSTMGVGVHLISMDPRVEDSFALTVAQSIAFKPLVAQLANSIINFEFERVHCVISEVVFPFHMSTQSLAIVSRFFVKVLNHARMMKKFHPKGCEGHNKRPIFQGRFGGSRSGSQFRGGSSCVVYPLFLSFQPQNYHIRFRQLFRLLMNVSLVLVFPQ